MSGRTSCRLLISSSSPNGCSSSQCGCPPAWTRESDRFMTSDSFSATCSGLSLSLELACEPSSSESWSSTTSGICGIPQLRWPEVDKTSWAVNPPLTVCSRRRFQSSIPGIPPSTSRPADGTGAADSRTGAAANACAPGPRNAALPPAPRWAFRMASRRMRYIASLLRCGAGRAAHS